MFCFKQKQVSHLHHVSFIFNVRLQSSYFSLMVQCSISQISFSESWFPAGAPGILSSVRCHQSWLSKLTCKPRSSRPSARTPPRPPGCPRTCSSRGSAGWSGRSPGRACRGSRPGRSRRPRAPACTFSHSSALSLSLSGIVGEMPQFPNNFFKNTENILFPQ